MSDLTRDKGWSYRLLAVFSLVFVFFVIPYIYISRQGLREKINHLSKAGVLTSAVVERHPPVDCGVEVYVACYYISYRFTISEPKRKIQFYAKVDVREYIYHALAQARFADVRYLSSEPRFSCLELDCNFSNTVNNEPIFEGFRVKQY
jgi:hypothetical protein